MAVPVGFAKMTHVIEAVGDPEPYNVVIGVQTDLATYSAVEHCNKVMANFLQAWNDKLMNTASLQKVVGTFGQDAADDLIVESTTGAITGGASGNFIAPNVALLVRKKTGLGGRRNRGRSFLPGVIDETQVNYLGQLVTASRDAFQIDADQWIDALAGDDLGTSPMTPMVILHSPDPVTGAVLAPTPVTTLEVDDMVATQRRRLRK